MGILVMPWCGSSRCASLHMEVRWRILELRMARKREPKFRDKGLEGFKSFGSCHPYRTGVASALASATSPETASYPRFSFEGRL